jgi:hypothetical protein
MEYAEAGSGLPKKKKKGLFQMVDSPGRIGASCPALTTLALA